MRTRVLELAALALLVGAVGLARGQTSAGPKGDKPAPAKSGLEEALAEALRSNPDLRAAAAKVALAEAELHRLRLQVVQKVVNAHRAVELAKAVGDEAEKRFLRLENQRKAARNSVSDEEFAKARQALLKAKADFAAAESELAYLLGKPARGAAGASRSPTGDELRLDVEWKPGKEGEELRLRARMTPREVKGAIADKLRKALDRPVTVKFSETPIADTVKKLEKELEGVHVQLVLLAPTKVTANFNEIPLGAVLQYLEDALGQNARIVVREYGLLITRRDLVPPGAVPLDDFWKGGVRADEGGKGAPPAGVEGVVKKVEDGGLVQISVGSDAGLAKGHTLEVFRLRPAPKYLGQIRVIEVKATEAVGKVVGRSLGEIRKDDRVAARVRGR